MEDGKESKDGEENETFAKEVRPWGWQAAKNIIRVDMGCVNDTRKIILKRGLVRHRFRR
jgi:hypothetical protein